MPHALLVSGPAGIGKSALADAFAQSLLCEAPQADAQACGRCDACRWYAAGNHPDLRRLEPGADDEGKPSKEIRIDSVRDLETFFAIGGHRGSARIVLVDPADALNPVAANALLKTLEEPTPGLHFVLVTGRPDALPVTVRSRCLALALPAVAPAAAVGWLQQHGNLSAQQAADLLAACGGSPLHAQALAGPSQAAAHRAVLEAIAGLPETGAVGVAERLGGTEPQLWLTVLQRWVADLGRVALGVAPDHFPGQRPRLAQLAQRVSPHRLASVARQLLEQRRYLNHPLNPKLFCEESLQIYLDAYPGNGTKE